MITKEDLFDCEEREEEDVICDGPIYLSSKQQQNFLIIVNNKPELLTYLRFKNGYEEINYIDEVNVMLDGYMSEEDEAEAMIYKNMVFELFADYLNSQGYDKEDLKQI